MKRALQKQNNTREIMNLLDTKCTDLQEMNEYLSTMNTTSITEASTYTKILSRPQTGISALSSLNQLKTLLSHYPIEHLQEAEIRIKYETYIKKEIELVERMQKLEHLTIPLDFNYHQITSLSAEAREKLQNIKPGTLGQASRISGISPSDISILLVHFGR
jgi:tRNA uridine 5-carboxymethylaminomethyl modification enzyme